MGLSNAHSGIGQVAKSLHRKLENTEFAPTVIGNFKPSQFGRSLPLTKISAALSKYKNINADICYHYAQKDAGGEPSILHGFANYNVPILLDKVKNFRFFLTIHDLIPLTHAQKVSRSQALQFRLGFFRAVKRADRIIAVSDWTKHAVLSVCPEVESKIVVLRNGRPQNLPTDFTFVRNAYNEFAAVFVGRFEIYKRFDLLAEIINLAPQSWKFCIVTDDAGKAKIQDQCRARMLSENLVVMTGLNDLEMSNIYQSSRCLLNTSLLEGFGLPAAEALSRALPVVWTTGSAMDEFCSNQVGQGLPPNAPTNGWLQAIERFQSFQPKLEDFQQVISQMPSWDEAAKQLCLLYAD
jgi:glycosyltransferase involved in cell wall biosynthesis